MPAALERGRRLFAQPCRFVAASRRASNRLPAEPASGDRLRRPLQRRQVEPDQRADRPEDARPHLADAGPDPPAQLLRPRRPADAGRSAGLRLRRGTETGDRRAGRGSSMPTCAAGRPCVGCCSSSMPAAGRAQIDRRVMTMLDQAAVSYQVALTKADKATKAELAAIGEAFARAQAAVTPRCIRRSP